MVSAEKSELTAINYRSRLKKWFLPWVQGKKLEDLKPSSIYQFRNYLLSNKRLSPSLINTILGALQSFWHYLLSNDIVSNNIFPGRGLTVKVAKHLPKPIDDDHIRKIFFFEKDPETRFLLILGFFAGLRLFEALHVRADDFDWQTDPPELKVRYGKGNKERLTIIIPYPNVIHEAQNFLREHRITYNRYAVFRRIKKIADRIGVPWFTYHKCRHTFATKLGSIGIEIGVIADLMGHESIITTRGYRQITMKRIRREVQNKFDESIYE